MKTKELLIASPTKCVSMLDFLANGGELKVGMKIAYRITHFKEDDSWIFHPSDVPMMSTELDNFRINQINELGESYIKHHNFHILLDDNVKKLLKIYTIINETPSF